MKRFWMTAFLLTGLFAVLAAPVAAKSSDDSSADTDTSMDDVNSALGSMAVKVNDLEKSLGLKFYGDLRTRYALEFQESGAAGVTILPSNRGRYRARFGVEKKMGDFTGNFRLSSGDPTNPNTENQTFDNAFADGTILIDTACITYVPSYFEGHVKLVAGKMSNPLTKTSITWDPDIQPEGAEVEVSSGDLKLRGTYFELQNENHSVTPTAFMTNFQLEDMFKIDSDTGIGLMAGYENIPNATQVAAIFAADGAKLTNNLTTADGNLFYHGGTGGILPDWNVVEGMLTFKHKVGDVPFKWTIHGTDNLAGANLPVQAGSANPSAALSKKFTNQYALWVGVDIGAVKEVGDFAGTLAYATLDPNSQLGFLTDDDPGNTNRQYAFGALTYGVADHVQLKLSEWLIGHEYYAYLAAPGNNSGPGGGSQSPASLTYVDCIASF